MLTALFSACYAGDWSIIPSLSIEGTYSDNINIAPDELEESDFVSEVNPQIIAELDGRRIKANLDYRMQNLFYATNSDKNTTYNQYFAHANSEVLLEKFYVDIDSALIQRSVDADRPQPIYNYSITNNRTNQLIATISPYWRQKIGTIAEGIVRYEYGIVDFDDDRVQGITSDSRYNELFLSISSIPQDRRFLWTVGYDNQIVKFDDNSFDDLKLKRTGTNISYRIYPGVRLLGFGGYEDNDFGSRTTTIDPKGAFWAAGFRWQPNTRNKLEARFGNRFFGDTYYVSWEQGGRYFNTELRYEEEIGDETKFLLEDTKTVSKSRSIDPFSLGLTADVFLRRRLFASASLKRLKTNLQISPYFEKRDFFDRDGVNEQVLGIDTSLEWNIAPRTAFLLRLILERKDLSSRANIDYFTHIVLRAQRKISPKTTGYIQYSYAQFDSDNNALIEYTENAFSLNLTWSF